MIIQPWPVAEQPSQQHQAISAKGVMMPPPIIYHYTSIKTAILIITGQTLYFAHPSTFNDPFDLYDGLVDFKSTAKQRRDWVDQQNLPREDRQAIVQKVLRYPYEAEGFFRESLRQTKDSLGICCFSEMYDQVLMWSHYADKHQGVCFGFSVNPIQHLKASHDFFVGRVNYPDRVQAKSYFDNMEEVVRHWVFTKSPCWAYEQEIRATINGITDPRTLRFEKACLKEVYFGCRTTDEQRNSIKKLLTASDFSLDSCRQMQIDDATFSVKASPCDYITT